MRTLNGRVSITPEDVRSSFRRIDPARYPELAGYSWDEIYGAGDKMAPGALYLAAEMTQAMKLAPGDAVLDLGCGKGVTSVFLSRHFGARVSAIDLWISADLLKKKFAAEDCEQQIVPYNLDIMGTLPFATEYFDSVFCMQSFHSFGGGKRFLHHLLGHLKKGGQICVAGTSFNEAFPGNEVSDVYLETDGWDAEYTKYRSPAWWRTLFEESGLVDVTKCYELEDGVVMWEDVILYGWWRAGWADTWFEKSKWLIKQVVHSRDHRPYLTHFLISAEKR